jgi:hypothetical protein
VVALSASFSCEKVYNFNECNHYIGTEMTENEATYDKLKIFIESAVEGEQIEVAPFNIETEKRLHLVFSVLKEALNLPPEYDA